MPHLAENHYGKSRVRVVKVVRSAAAHRVFEWSVDVYLTGDFGPCFLDGDNTGLLATDTMKNTVYLVAQTSTACTIEDFAQELARFLMDRNPQLSSATVAVQEKAWMHLEVNGHPSAAAFRQSGPEVATTTIVLTRGGTPVITSGVQGLVILKTAHSAFTGFKRDELTTLPETEDRLLGTEATITWLYSSPPPDFTAAREGIVSTLLATFATHHSRSVQQTLYAMAAAALASEPLLAELSLTMPNRHNIPIDFSRFAAPFNLRADNSVFVPQDEPSGHIHARVIRDAPPASGI